MQSWLNPGDGWPGSRVVLSSVTNIVVFSRVRLLEL